MTTNQKTYVVATTGGYEIPSFKAVANYAAAFDLAGDWSKEVSDEDGEMIHILEIDLTTFTINTEYVKPF